jgi:NADPH-dependent 2,4-dienoyl-CoA reductase/sulfur reductase-like enzyme
VTRLVIVGGSDAGVEAALAARRKEPNIEIELLLEDGFPNYSICGLPFLVSGEVAGWRQLAHRSRASIESEAIRIRTEHRVVGLDVGRQSIDVDAAGDPLVLPYDQLILATGASPAAPPVTTPRSARVRVLHTMRDGIELRQHIGTARPRDAVIVGTGYIGVEMADALTRLGIGVTMIGRAPWVLPSMSGAPGSLIQDELERMGVSVLAGHGVLEIRAAAGRAAVVVDDGGTLETDLVLVATGVRPNAELALDAGIATGVAGAIRVDQRMQTSVPGVLAAGDCAETYDTILKRSSYLPLGTTAHKQGRVAGSNAAGGDATFAGSIGTQVVKVFDLAAGRTGLSIEKAESNGFDARAVRTVVPDHTPYYPDAHDLDITIVGDASDGRLLGAEIVGDWRAGVAKRLDVFAVAAQHEWRVHDLLDADLSYTPPLGAPWDPIQVAADAWHRAVRQDQRPTAVA